jgi:hypothetical protein
MAPDQLEAIDSIDVALGIESSHPDITFVPALSLQANLPRPIAGEAEYLLHFGPSETPDILWTGNADTGRPLAASVALAPEHVARLRAGDPMTLTAIRDGGGPGPEGLYAIELTSLNQVPPVEALLGYMSRQLSADLTQLIPPAADSGSPTDSTGVPN